MERRPDRLLRLSEVTAICGLSSSTVYRLIASGKFPKQVVIDGTMARWSYRAVQKWIRDTLAESREAAS